jgi:formylglycine-generating enzyme required for sulfatase activity
MGAALTQAQSWLAKRPEDLPRPDRKFIALSMAREKAEARARRLRALVYVLLIFVISGLVAWINQSYLEEQVKYVWIERPFAAANIWPYVLKPAAEQALKADPNKSFRECAPKQQDKDYCPDMVVIPAGSFMMGRPATKKGLTNEVPQHTVTIAKPFAVSKFKLTFDEWDTCARYGDCRQDVKDFGFGRGQRPVIEVTWDDAHQYVAWLSKMTGEPYRLLTEAEHEYARRAGTTTAYPWGDDIGTNKAN